jgi:excisionase family DNA binding protein
MEDSSRPLHSRSLTWSVKPPVFDEHMLGAAHVAKMLGMSARTVRYLASIGELPGSKVGRAWRFWRIEILEYIEKRRGENLLG